MTTESLRTRGGLRMLETRRASGSPHPAAKTAISHVSLFLAFRGDYHNKIASN